MCTIVSIAAKILAGSQRACRAAWMRPPPMLARQMLASYQRLLAQLRRLCRRLAAMPNLPPPAARLKTVCIGPRMGHMVTPHQHELTRRPCVHRVTSTQTKPWQLYAEKQRSGLAAPRILECSLEGCRTLAIFAS